MVQDKFLQSKKIHLDKLYLPDKSKKGDVDKLMIPLIDKLNSSDNYFTTSSCSGRIMLLKPAQRKHDVEWLFSSHEKVNIQELIKKIYESAKDNTGLMLLKVEGFILHVACRTIEDADKLLNIAKKVGLKRSGIISIGNKIMLEIMSSELIEIPVVNDDKILADDEYLEFIINQSNKKLETIHNRIKKLEGAI